MSTCGPNRGLKRVLVIFLQNNICKYWMNLINKQTYKYSRCMCGRSCCHPLLIGSLDQKKRLTTTELKKRKIACVLCRGQSCPLGRGKQTKWKPASFLSSSSYSWCFPSKQCDVFKSISFSTQQNHPTKRIKRYWMFYIRGKK